MTKQQKTKPIRKKPPETDTHGLFQALRYSLWSPAKQLSAWLFVAAIATVYLYALLFGPAGGVRIASDGIYSLPASRAKPQIRRPLNIETLAGELEKMHRQISLLKQRERLLETRMADLQSALGPATSALPSKDGSGATGAGTSQRSAPAVDESRSPLPGAGFGDDFAAKSPIPSELAKQPTRTMFALNWAKTRAYRISESAGWRWW